jgi:hypothetical protein
VLAAGNQLGNSLKYDAFTSTGVQGKVNPWVLAAGVQHKDRDIGFEFLRAIGQVVPVILADGVAKDDDVEGSLGEGDLNRMTASQGGDNRVAGFLECRHLFREHLGIGFRVQDRRPSGRHQKPPFD